MSLWMENLVDAETLKVQGCIVKMKLYQRNAAYSHLKPDDGFFYLSFHFILLKTGGNLPRRFETFKSEFPRR